MGFLDKAKSALGDAAQMAKSKAEEVKANVEQGRAEKEAALNEAKSVASAKSAEIINSVLAYTNDGVLFNGLDGRTLSTFTKSFYDKLVLPASSVSLTKITMHPAISQKMLDRFSKTVPMFNASETALVHIKAEKKQELLFTENALYFVLNFTDNDKALSIGRIPAEQVNECRFELGADGGTSTFYCDEYPLATFTTDKSLREDFIAMNEYFRRINANDLDISDEDVDAMIREKIGEKVVGELNKYMIYDDERFEYFAWGVNSLTAKDYIVCTNYQIIVLDREMFGATANIKQLYYEDITSAATEQNSNSNDLTGYLIDTALTAATKTCDLKISVAGSTMTINTLFKVEAERIVEVYHEHRKAAKQAAKQPQVIVQQAAAAPAADPLEQITKLKSLFDAGIISEAEFNEKKAALLAQI